MKIFDSSCEDHLRFLGYIFSELSNFNEWDRLARTLGLSLRERVKIASNNPPQERPQEALKIWLNNTGGRPRVGELVEALKWQKRVDLVKEVTEWDSEACNQKCKAAEMVSAFTFSLLYLHS